MNILHTSDWHLGRNLLGRKRYEEFEAFFAWLADIVEQEEIEVLLVSGDIFDNNTPSNRAQELYYRFVSRVAQSSCRHVVLTAGNHDSPSFLDAPREVLRFLNVYVVGSISDDCRDEVLLLRDSNGEPELIVCAVPYLRDRDIRSVDTGESREEKERKLIEGIREHYQQVCAHAEQLRNSIGKPLPIIGMGHLFAAGGSTVEGDGVRDLYVGSLAHVGVDIFPKVIDYLALGHLHTPQLVGGNEFYRYSGAPLAMGFGETGRTKSVCKLELSGNNRKVTTIAVPVFQIMQSIRGDWNVISESLQELREARQKAWVEVIYEGTEILSDLREKIAEAVERTDIEVLRIRDNRIYDRNMVNINDGEILNELDTDEVFLRCLNANEIPENQQEELWRTYHEVIASLTEEDLMAE